MTTREEIIETVNRLFIYTDQQDWQKLKELVFSPLVHLDMSTLGGPILDTTAEDICKMWSEGFNGLDAINHLAGNYLVTVKDDNTAQVFAYATATHYKASAKNGKTRDFVGTYDLELKSVDKGWRIHRFIYQLKYITGNVTLD